MGSSTMALFLSSGWHALGAWWLTSVDPARGRRPKRRSTSGWWQLLVLLSLGLACGEQEASAADAVCAEVKIVIEQKLSLERQAFDAHMVISNGLDGAALEDIQIDLTFQDSNEQPVVATTDPNAVGASFFYRTDSLNGIAAIDGSGEVAPKTDADIHWLIIPAEGTGGSSVEGVIYYVGAAVTYTLNGQTNTVEVTPDYIIVRPQPSLDLDYFLPTDVLADDPNTAEIEPQVPFTLGVRITNVGYGTAFNTSIESAQPKIVENEHGLLIGFEILGGYIADEPAGKSLLLDFGDIPPSTAVVGRWNMVTTLVGQFTEFDATYTHADTLGGAVTSLLRYVTTHTLVHDVKVDLPGRDAIRDFLALDTDVMRIYESEGGKTDVTDQSAIAQLSLSGNNGVLTFPATPGFVYAQVRDPYRGAKRLVSVVRSDGKVLSSENFWLSKTRDTNNVWWYYINLFDANSTGSYTITFTDGTSASLAGVVYDDQNANGIREPSESGVPVLLVTLSGLGEDGVGSSASGYTDALGEFSFGSLAPGTYSLTVAPLDGKVDGVALAGSAGGVAGEGSITNIVLLAGASAQGYTFAKRIGTGSGSDSADLAVTLGATPLVVGEGDSVTFELTASNSGPSSVADASLTFTLPDGLLEQSASASSGSYSAGSWGIGTLASGQSATLTVTATAESVSENMLALASIGSSVTDPALANNSASITLQADQGSFDASQSVMPELRLLLLASCQDQQGAEDAVCAAGRATFAADWLTEHGYPTQAVTSLSAFRTALRSGQYNGVWLDAGADKLTTSVLEEVRALVRRGGALVLEGAPDSAIATLDDLWGGSFVIPAVGQDQLLTINDGGATVQTVGDGWQLNLTGAAELAQFSAGSAVAMAGYGEGNTLVFGFNVLDTLQDEGAEPVLGALLVDQLELFVPPSADPILAYSVATIETTVMNASDSAGEAALAMTLPVGVSYLDATPQPTSSGSQQVQWDLPLAAEESQSVRLAVMMPSTSGMSNIESEITDSADDSIVATFTQEFNVLGADILIASVQSELAALAASSTETALMSSAVDAAQAAQVAFEAADYDTAITQLILAEQALRALTETDAELVRLDIAQWMALAEGAWQDNGTTPSSITATSGTPQSAVVEQPFAASLVVTVRNAEGDGVAGVEVTFIAPETGAAATFAGGLNSATAVTDVDGVATAPALTANATEGSYTVTASVTALAAVAEFELSNLSAVQLPNSITAVAGDGQTAMIGTQFASTLQAQVQDSNGLPIAGIDVTFTLPEGLASATFEGGTTTAVAATDSNGIATSPLLTASATAGSYEATASVAGLEQSASFALFNADSVLATTTTLLSHMPNPSVPGQVVLVVYDVAVTQPEMGSLSGNEEVVVSYAGALSGTLCQATVADGSCSGTLPEAGEYTLTVSFAGGGQFASSSATDPHVVMVSESCSGDPLTISDHTFAAGTATLCNSTISIDTSGSVEVESGATAEFNAPAVHLTPGFHATPGSYFRAGPAQ